MNINTSNTGKICFIDGKNIQNIYNYIKKINSQRKKNFPAWNNSKLYHIF